MKRILLALDLREPEVLTRAVEDLATRLGAELYAIHVMPPPDAMPFSGYEGLMGLEGLPYALYDPAINQEREQAEESALNRFLQERFTRPIRAAMRQGDPASIILDDAAEFAADLIVLGYRHHGFVEKMFAGSVASAVLKEATRPTLLFPIDEA